MALTRSSWISRFLNSYRYWKLLVTAISAAVGLVVALWVTAVHGPKPVAYSLTICGIVFYYLYCTNELFRRRMIVYWTAILVVVDYKFARRYSHRYFPEDTRVRESEAFWERVHRRNAQRTYRAFIALEGLWIKTGQYLSSRADVLPEVYIEELSQCQDQVPFKKSQETSSTIEEELGGKISSIFEYFNPRPLACASIAQVHEAVYNGEKVVVKVQHKNIEATINQDLANLRKIIAGVAWIEPDFDFRPVINEWAREVPYELDFVHEAANMKRVEREMQTCLSAPKSSPLHLDVVFPQVIDRLTTKKVLVMSYIDGFKVTDIEKLNQYNVDRDELLRNIARAFGNQIFRYGFFNGDPHPGNILITIVNGKPTPALLDFGLTKEIDNTTRINFSKMAICAKDNDLFGLLNSIDDLGVKFNSNSDFLAKETLNLTKFFFRDSQPTKEMREEFSKHVETQKKKMEIKMQDDESLRRNPIDAFPEALVFFQRTIYLIRGLASGLGVHMKYLDLLSPFAISGLTGSDAISEPLPFPRTSTISSTVAEKVMDMIMKMQAENQIQGCQVAVWHKGKPIVDIAVGRLEKYKSDGVTPSTVFNSFSCTKAVVAVAMARCVELGLADYSDFVQEHWPEFRTKCTIAQVLGHVSGLQSAGIQALRKNGFAICQWEKMVNIMAEAEPEGSPGDKEVYHALSFGWIVGGIIERVAKMPLREFVRREISEPLGIQLELQMGLEYPAQSQVATLSIDFEEEKRRAIRYFGKKALTGGIGLSAVRDLHDVANRKEEIKESLIFTNPTMFNHKMVASALIPSANGHFSARALAKFYAALANGGVLPGTDRRILKESSVARLMVGVNTPRGRGHYGAGVRLYEIKNGGDTAVGFGHDGLGGSSGACVPSEQLSIAMMVNGLSVMDPHSTRVVDCVFDVLKIGKLESNEGAIEMDIQTLATVKEVFSIA